MVKVGILVEGILVVARILVEEHNLVVDRILVVVRTLVEAVHNLEEAVHNLEEASTLKAGIDFASFLFWLNKL